MAEYWWDKALTLDDHEYSREEVKRILAKVPSYTEWQAKDSQIDYLKQKVSVLESKNQQLKELLSKCLDELAEFNNSYYPETQELFSQITNAIGEK